MMNDPDVSQSGADLVVGRRALERSLVTPEQIKEALADQARDLEGGRPVPRTLGNILLDRGFLTRSQLEVLVEGTIAESSVLDKARRRDVALARQLIDQKAITPNRVNDCFLLLSEAVMSGRQPAPRLADILLEKGFVTPEELDKARRCLEQLSLSRRAAGLPAEEGLEAADFSSASEGGTSEADKKTVQGIPPLGKYVILRELGRGGMGVVYEALDSVLNRRVALKLMLQSVTARPEAAQREEERFLREARLSANLPPHPNIVTVYEAGVIQARHYLAMEFIEGRSLSDWRRSGAPLRDQVRVLCEVLLALEHAHEHNVIHRDLKPQNILVDAKNSPHVVDFGLAKRVDAEAGASLTAAGAVLGTPMYMSPEQARGDKEVDRRTDVYAVGTMLYEILTGEAPFRGTSVLDILMKVVRQPLLPPSRVPRPEGAPPVDPVLESICLKAMARNPRDRYRSADAFAGHLVRWLEGKEVRVVVPVEAGTASPSRFRAWTVAAVAAFAILIAGVLLTRPRTSFETERDRYMKAMARAARAMEREDYSEAMAAYQMALALDPGNAAALEGKSDAEARIEERQQRMRAKLEQAKLEEEMAQGILEEKRRLETEARSEEERKRIAAEREAAERQLKEAIQAKEAAERDRADEAEREKAAAAAAEAEREKITRERAASPVASVKPPPKPPPATASPPPAPAPPAPIDRPKAPLSDGLDAAWMVAGPFLTGTKGAGFEKDYGPETETDYGSVHRDDLGNPVAWKRRSASAGVIDFIETFGPQVNALAYASTYLFSPDPVTAVFHMGSDDGLVVWLNGKQVLRKRVWRGLNADEEHLKVPLRQGWNSVLLKVDTGDGGWGMAFRVEGADGRPLGGLRISPEGPGGVKLEALSRKRPVPDGARQSEVKKSLEELYKADYVRTLPADRKTFAQKLLRHATEARQDPDERFVVLSEVRDLAAGAGDFRTALVAIDLIAGTFEVEPAAMKISTLTNGTRALRTPADAARLAECYVMVAEEALGMDDFAPAKAAASKALGASRTARDAFVQHRVESLGREILTLEKEFVSKSVQEAQRRIEDAPDDAAPNSVVGRYRCLGGDWTKGVVLLARGSDATLRSAASKELSKPVDAEQFMDIGNAWWEVSTAERDFARTQFQRHAVIWYQKAWPKLDPLGRSRIRDRLKSAAAAKVPGGAPASATIPQHWTLSEGAARYARLDDRFVHGGRASLYVAPSPGNVTRAQRMEVPAAAGDKLTFTGWVFSERTTAGQGRIMLCVRTVGSRFEFQDIPLPDDQPFWTQVTGTITCPPSGRSVYLIIEVGGKAGEYWLDDFSIRKSGDERELTGDTFER